MGNLKTNNAGKTWRVVNALAGYASLSLIPFSMNALAESVSSESTANLLEEVIVTAQYREQSVQETPLSVTALSSDLMEARSSFDIAAAANFAPNVTLAKAPSGLGQTAAVFIRGVGQNDPNFALEPGVGLYMDDIYYGVMSGGIFQLADLDRVEVLRGPQGTLAGKNSIGGSIKLFSARPDSDTNGYAEVGYGENNFFTARAATNITLKEDVLYARVSGGTRSLGDFVDRLDFDCTQGDTSGNGGSARLTPNNCTLGSEGGEDIWTVRGSLLWTPTDQIENLLVLDRTNDSSSNPPLKTIQQFPTWAGANDYFTGDEEYTNFEDNRAIPTGEGANEAYALRDDTTLEQWGVSNNFTVSFDNDMVLTSITGYRESESILTARQDGTPASIIDQAWRLYHEQFTQELRLSGAVGEILDWTVGGFYYDAEGESDGRITISGGLAPGGGGLNFDFLFRDPVDVQNQSAFFHGVLHATDKFDITVGARYSEDEKTFAFGRYDIDGDLDPVLGALTGESATFEDDRVDYRLVADYDISDTAFVYAQYSTGFKGGAINPRPFFGTQVITVEPEELDSYELGFKADFFGGTTRLNGAVFFNEYTNFQGQLLSCDFLSPFPGAPCAASFNIGDAEITGLELEASVRLPGGLDIDATVGVIDFEYTEVNALSGVPDDAINVYTPELTATLGVQYDFLLGDAGKITPRLDVSHRSEIYTEFVNTDLSEIEALTLANAKISWQNADEDWTVSLVVTNLTDEFYYTSKNVREGPPYWSSTGIVARPREVFATVKRSF